MKEPLKQLGVKKWSLVAFLALVALWELPGFEGNPTGLMLLHIHAERYIKRNEQAIVTTYETTVAMDERKGSEFHIFKLESLILQTELSTVPQNKKDAIIKRYQFKLDRWNKILDRKNDKLDKLESEWNNYGIAKSSN